MQYSSVQFYCAVQFSTVLLYSTVQYSFTVQYSSVQFYCTVQFSTIEFVVSLYIYLYLFIYRDIYVCIYTRIYIYIYWDTTNCIVLFCTHLYINLSTPLNTSRSMCRNLLCRNSNYFRLLTPSNIPCIISLTL